MFPPDPGQSTSLACEEHSYGVLLSQSLPSIDTGFLTTIVAQGQRPDLDSFGKTYMAIAVENGNQPVGFPNGPMIQLRIVVGHISYSPATSGRFD